VSPAKLGAERRFARAANPSEAGPLRDDGGRLVERLAASVRADPAFVEIGVDEIRAFVAATIAAGEAAIDERHPPTPNELDAAVAVTLALARSGVPLDAIDQLRRLALRHVFDAWREDAHARGAEPAAQLDRLYSLWRWADAVAARASAAHRQTESEVASTAPDRRESFLRGLLEGTLSAAEVEGRAAAYGLLPGGRYMALRGRPGPHGDPGRLRSEVERAGRTDCGGALAAAVDDEVWGLVSRRPEMPAGEGVVGLGSVAELREADASFRVAARVLDTAVAFGLDGVVTMDDLSLRPVILAEDHLGEELVRRYLEPLSELGEFGATLERTVEEYLASGMRIDESARALIIHPNTLRHRLDRFQQVTGADVRRIEDLAEIWWALQRRKVSS
jgi:hypothetical protein